MKILSNNGKPIIGNGKAYVAPGGNEEAPFKDVCFYDYDGRRLYSYTAEEALALTALPALPTNHASEGITPEEWNYTLAEMQEEVRVQGVCDVGVTYATNDGKTHIHIHLDDPAYLSPAIHLSSLTASRTVTVDWGDGSPEETFSSKPVKHTYASVGDYVIKFSSNYNEQYIYRNILFDGVDDNTKTMATSKYMQAIKRVHICNMGLGVVAIQSCVIDHVLLSKTCRTVTNGTSALNYVRCPIMIYPSTSGYYLFSNNINADKVIYPPYQQTSSEAMISYMGAIYAKDRNIIPHTFINYRTQEYCISGAQYIFYHVQSALGSQLYRNHRFQQEYIYHDNITSIGGECYGNNENLKKISFGANTVVPTLANTNAFVNCVTGLIIRVPESLYNDWIAATNWVTLYENGRLVFEKIPNI